jgi:hypothetical protein
LFPKPNLFSTLFLDIGLLLLDVDLVLFTFILGTDLWCLDGSGFYYWGFLACFRIWAVYSLMAWGSIFFKITFGAGAFWELLFPFLSRDRFLGLDLSREVPLVLRFLRPYISWVLRYKGIGTFAIVWISYKAGC